MGTISCKKLNEDGFFASRTITIQDIGTIIYSTQCCREIYTGKPYMLNKLTIGLDKSNKRFCLTLHNSWIEKIKELGSRLILSQMENKDEDFLNTYSTLAQYIGDTIYTFDELRFYVEMV